MQAALPEQKPIPMKQIIAQALARIAHAIDARFDEQQDFIEKLENRIVMVKRSFGVRLNSAIQNRQAQVEDTMKIFQDCVEAVRNEVYNRKKE